MPDGQVGFVGKDVATILEYANQQKRAECMLKRMTKVCPNIAKWSEK